MKQLILGSFIVAMGIMLAGCSESSDPADPAVLSSAKAITAFSFASPAAAGTVTEASHTIAITVPSGTDVTALIPTITHTGKSINPASGVPNDFTSPVHYVVTAENATTSDYEVTVTIAAPVSHVATLTSTAYAVSAGGTASETITGVRDATGKAAFLAALTKGEDHQTWTETGVSDPVATGNTLVVTAQDGITAVTYTVTVNAPLIVGDAGPVGGKIFYVNPNYATDGWKYMEAATSATPISAAQASPSGWVDRIVTWSNVWYTYIGTTGTAIGTGLANSNAIVAQPGHTTSAAKLCRDYRGGGTSDWFLPSQDELNQLYINQVAIGGFFANNYWCSSETGVSGLYAGDQHFGAGFYEGRLKEDGCYVRPVRAF